MERVAFLLEDSNERLVCLLNPESLEIRRAAGVRTRSSVGGQLTGVGLADDPLLYTGGGRTELELELLFDVALAGSTVTTDDVRTLTAPFWNLSENRQNNGGYGRLPLVRFIWGKHWNIPGVVVSVAERMEQFTAAGAPQRSWLRMRLLRVQDPAVQTPPTPSPADLAAPALDTLESELEGQAVRYHEILEGERLDDVATQLYGVPAYWRLIAEFNNIADPFELPAGMILVIPPAPDAVWWLLRTEDELAEAASETFSSLLRLRPVSPLRIAL